MATRVRSGALLPVIVAVAAVVVFGGNKVIGVVTDLFGGDGTSVIGEGDLRVMVSSDAGSDAERCGAKQMLTDKRCGDRKVVVIDAARMPFIARNIALAWGEGHKFLLTRDADERTRQARYYTSCRSKFVRQYRDGSCDEFEFASTAEGGQGARTEEVPLREQRCQGGTISAAYQYVPIDDGEQFMVVIGNPDKIAAGPYKGVDIAKDRSCES